jgi:hypothetical protein
MSNSLLMLLIVLLSIYSLYVIFTRLGHTWSKNMRVLMRSLRMFKKACVIALKFNAIHAAPSTNNYEVLCLLSLTSILGLLWNYMAVCIHFSSYVGSTFISVIQIQGHNAIVYCN